MVAGHLQEKNGYYHSVLEYRDTNGKRKKKWISTKLPVKGNKKKAEAMLLEARQNFVEPETLLVDQGKVLYSDFILEWLEVTKSKIAIPTYSSYSTMVKSIIVPYFKEKNILLQDLHARDIQQFYTQQLKRVKANSVIHYHANIHSSLKYAVKMDLIPSNPADKVERPRIDRFIGSHYSKEEMTALFGAVKGHKLELGVLLGAFYGLRKSEILGLKWSAIDFEANTITIKHTVCRVNLDGKSVIVKQDRTKTKSSFRTLPLVRVFRKKLLEIKEQQKENQKLCGNAYKTDNLEYIYLDLMGELINPNYLSSQFPAFLVRNGMRKIRFHDLRHSCASLLLQNGVSLKQIQEWLGHSDFATTANIYAHLDFDSKISSANAMLKGLNLFIPEDEEDTQKDESCQPECLSLDGPAQFS